LNLTQEKAMINIGDTVKTSICAKGDYRGRDLVIENIQEDVEMGMELYSGVVARRDGKKGKQRYQFRMKDVISGQEG